MIFASILAGGVGERMNLGIPKQFYKINNKPLLIHCVEKFLDVNEFDKIIVSSPRDYMDKSKLILKKHISDSRVVLIEGGNTRNDTILNSIYYAIDNGADDNSVMVTHDAARIFVTTELIKNSIKYAFKYGACSPIIPATDVIFYSKDGKKLSDIPNRDFLFHAQTPQSFNINKFLKIYHTLSNNEINSLKEAMMLFNLRNEEIYLFNGDFDNFKITNPQDIKLAEFLLK